MRLAALALALSCNSASAQYVKDDDKAAPPVLATPAVGKKLQLTRLVKGALETVARTKKDIDWECPNCIAAIPVYGRPPHFFDSLRTYERFLVEDCADYAAYGQTARVDRVSTHLCEKKSVMPDLRHQSAVRYDIGKKDDGVHLGLTVHFIASAETSGQRAMEMLDETIKSCKQPLVDFYARYGLKLDLDFILTKNSGIPEGMASHPPIDIDLKEGIGRADSATYYYRGQWPEFMRRVRQCLTCAAVGAAAKEAACPAFCSTDMVESYCLTMAHELGHSLGLPDEYPDPDCPDRTTLATENDPRSVMDYQFGGWESFEFFPRHIASILRPLCAGSDAIINHTAPPMFLKYSKD